MFDLMTSLSSDNYMIYLAIVSYDNVSLHYRTICHKICYVIIIAQTLTCRTIKRVNC